MARPKGRRGSSLGTSLLRMSLSRNPKRILFTPAVAIVGKGRRDREAGNNEFRMVCRAGRLSGGDIREARGDGTVYSKAAGRLTSLYLGLLRGFGQVHAFRAVAKNLYLE